MSMHVTVRTSDKLSLLEETAAMWHSETIHTEQDKMNFKKIHKSYFKVFNAEQGFIGLLYYKAADVNICANVVSETFYSFQSFELRYLYF